MRVNAIAYLSDALLTMALVLEFISLATREVALGALIVVGLALLAGFWIMHGSASRNVRLLALLGVSLGMLVAWAAAFGIGTAILGLVGTSLWMVRRVRFVQGIEDDEVQLGRFIWDMGAMAFGVLVSGTDGASLLVLRHILDPVFAAAALLRIGAMRSAQVARAKQRGVMDAPPLMGPWMLGAACLLAALFAVVWFPAVRILVIWIAAAALVALWLFEIRKNLVGVLVLAAMGVGVMVLLHSLHHHPFKRSNTAGPISPFRNLHLHRTVSQPVHVPAWVWLIVTVAVVIAAFVVWSRHWRQSQGTATDGVVPVIERKPFVRPTKRSYRNGEGIRGLVARWLTVAEHAGNPISSGETLRTFANRTRDKDGVPMPTMVAQQVIDYYEVERYGQRPASEAVVEQLERHFVADIQRTRAHRKPKG